MIGASRGELSTLRRGAAASLKIAIHLSADVARGGYNSNKWKEQVLGASENKEIHRRALEGVWSTTGSAPVEEVYAPNFVSHQHSHPTGGDIEGIDALRSFVTEFHRAFPDLVDAVYRQVAEGDLVTTQFTSRGTHQGELMGVAATGRPAEWMGIELARIEDGKIVENWVSWDLYGMLQQLGVTSVAR
jgi:steroid delta-isomerase-like uncharacterized protein